MKDGGRREEREEGGLVVRHGEDHSWGWGVKGTMGRKGNMRRTENVTHHLEESSISFVGPFLQSASDM